MANVEAPSSRQLFLVLLSVSIPSFMINLDSNIVAVSLPSIAQSFHASFADMEWVISAYTLTFASAVMASGALADRYGRRKILLYGLAVFTLASLACGAAPTVAILNAARAFQGIGAALQLSGALAILSHEFRGPARARAFAFWGSVIGIAASLGPIVGGVITQHFGWEWAFYANIPVGIVTLLMVLRSVDESRNPDAGPIDIWGILFFAAALFLATLGLISANREGWSNPAVIIELVGAALLLLGFVLVERARAAPMLDLTLFRKPTYVGANIAGCFYAATLLTMFTYLPIWFQNGLRYSAQDAGLLMLPMALPLFFVPRLVVAYLGHRLSGRDLLALGLVLVSVGLFAIGLEIAEQRYVLILGGLLIAGCGAGILNGETAKVGMTVVPPERAGMASGVAGTIRFSGIVLGFAALGAILQARILASIDAQLPNMSSDVRSALARRVAAGSLPGIGDPLHAAAHASITLGYQAILFCAALAAAVSALAVRLLVRQADTLPTQSHPLQEPIAVLTD